MNEDLLVTLSKFIKESMGMMIVLDSKILALVNLLPADKQQEWLKRHNQYCHNKGVSPIDGLKHETTKSPGINE